MDSVIVAQFNQVLLMLIEDIAAAAPASQKLAEALEGVTSMLVLDKSDSMFVNGFMNAMASVSSFIDSSNPIENMLCNGDLSTCSNFISRSELQHIYTSLSVEDKASCGVYLKTLYRLGKAAMPEGSVSTLAISPHSSSPVHAMVTSLRGIDSSTATGQPGAGLMATMFKTLSLSLLQHVKPHSDEAYAMIESMDPNDTTHDGKNLLLTTFQLFYSDEASAMLLQEPEKALKLYGIPYTDNTLVDAASVLANATTGCRDEILSISFRLAACAVAMSQLSAEALTGIESFAQQLDESDIDLNNMNPVDLLQLGERAFGQLFGS
jgi:hypothetical protein